MELQELQPENKTRKIDNYPKGIIVLMIWYAYSAFSLVWSSFNPVLIVGSIVLVGIPVVLFNVAQILVLIYLIYGLIKALNIARIILIWYSIIMFSISTVFFLTYFFNKEEVIKALSTFTPKNGFVIGAGFYDFIFGVSFCFSLVTTSLILIYINKRRSYFIN